MAESPALCRGGCVLAIDEALLAAQADFVAAAFGDMPRIVLPSGEPTKCFAWLERICEFLAEKRVARDGTLFACGGGVTGDIAGFAASSYLRGIGFVQVPTTLLAMVDSSVGGKTGINIGAGKNLVGAFWQPRAVFADTSLLASLPEREFPAGMAEVIKYGMLGDAALFEQLETLPLLDAESADLPGIVARCCSIKADVVGTDERETAANNGRALLNLGHTFGHAVEKVAGLAPICMARPWALACTGCEAVRRDGPLSTGDVRRVKALLERYSLPTALRAPCRCITRKGRRQRQKVRAGSCAT
jgi:3-dehydroquinate synthase